MNVLLGLTPFIAFFLLTRFTTVAIGLWAAAAVALALIVRSRLRTRGQIKLLEAGALALFVVLAAIASFLRPAWSVFEVRVLVDLGLVVIALGSIAVGQPFTLQYARERAPPELHRHPVFITVNRRISAVWALAFFVEAVSSACVAWVPGVPPTLPIAINVAAIVGAVYFTTEYPKRVRARFALRAA